MNEFQRRIKRFTAARDWGQFHNPKGLLLGIVEEDGEIRNLVKWEQDPKKLQRVLAEHREELEDDIGDIYWFLALLTNANNINLDEAIDGVIRKNETRFPVAETRSRHTNRHLGGRDRQYGK